MPFLSLKSQCQNTMPPTVQASIFGACPKPGLIGRVVPGRASGVKWWGWQRWEHQLVLMGWQSIQTVVASACVMFILQLHQKIQKCTFWYQLIIRVVPDKVQRAVKWLALSEHYRKCKTLTSVGCQFHVCWKVVMCWICNFCNFCMCITLHSL